MLKELQILSNTLFVFILINVVIYFFLQLKRKEKIFWNIFLYWLASLFLYVGQSVTMERKTSVVVILFLKILPLTVVANTLARELKSRFKLWSYLKVSVGAAVLTLISHKLFHIQILLFLPLILAYSFITIDSLKETIKNSAENRMAFRNISLGLISGVYITIMSSLLSELTSGEATKIVLFSMEFLGLLAVAVFFPMFAMDTIQQRAIEKLRTKLESKIHDLKESRLEKERMLRVLVHDIANPLQAAMLHSGQTLKVFNKETKATILLGKLNKSLLAIRDIIAHVREYQSAVSRVQKNYDLEDVYLSECLENIEEIFNEQFSQKDVKLLIHNKLADETKIRVCKVAFIHGVASNLMSNALKFSRPGSEVLIVASERDFHIVIEIVDRGVGMPKETVNQLFDVGARISRRGTLGEAGIGFGMPVVKAYMSMFGGRIEVISSQVEHESGTTVSLFLPDIRQYSYSISATT